MTLKTIAYVLRELALDRGWLTLSSRLERDHVRVVLSQPGVRCRRVLLVCPLAVRELDSRGVTIAYRACQPAERAAAFLDLLSCEAHAATTEAA